MDTPELAEVFTIAGLKQASATTTCQGMVRAQLDSIQTKPTKSGNPFLELKLADGQDHFTLRIWGDAPQFAVAQPLKPQTFIAVTGEWTLGTYGLEPRNWSLRPLTAEEKDTLLQGPPALREKQAVDYGHILDLIASIHDPRLRGLAELFIADFGERFRRTAAARDYHHARRGGLVEHVSMMMRSAAALCNVYTDANRDLLLTGVLFHDVGKLWENSYPADGFNMPFSEHGEMLGHITLGIELVNKLWRKLLDAGPMEEWMTFIPTNEDVRLHLLHLIASHHGEYAFGSPVLPKTPEAILLHHVDNIDAKMEMFTKAYATSAFLAKNIQEKMRPLPANVVTPLAKFPRYESDAPPTASVKSAEEA
jgi:3'-5' exoribonuclease